MSSGSLRPPVGAREIREFLEALGREFHGCAQVYLVGGATLVYEGLRPTTLDIDLSLAVDSAQHGRLIEAIRSLKQRLQLIIEEASPADFIPLPSGAQDRRIWIGKFGDVDAFHFDSYSFALGKIDRGQEKDFEDVDGLLDAGRIELERLRQYYEEILPRCGRESLRQDPDRLRRHFEALEARRRTRQGDTPLSHES